MANNYVWGVCTKSGCNRRNYRLHKGPKIKYKILSNKGEPLSKYCRWCRAHTPHKEVK